MNFASLLGYTNLFFSKTSGLKEDLAKRMMYSVLPHLSTPGETYQTRGVIDMKALRAATEGRKNIISMGLQAIGRELGHYNDVGRGEEVLVNEFWRASTKYPIKAADIAIKAFGSPRGWMYGFGGEPWKRIAETLKKIIHLDQQLDGLRHKRKVSPAPEDLDAELETMRQLVVEINVFDGLSHNTASIMKNLISMENFRDEDENEPKEKKEERAKKEMQTYRDYMTLMDAKELKDPVEVFKLIEPTLQGSGDIHRFKDWVEKLRRLPEYRREDPTIQKQLFTIRSRKHLMAEREKLEEPISKMERSLQAITKPLSNDSLQAHLQSLLTWAGAADSFAAAIPASYMGEHSEGFRALRKKLQALYSELAEIMSSYFNQPFEEIRTATPDKYAHLIKKSEEFLSKLKSIKFFLDAI